AKRGDEGERAQDRSPDPSNLSTLNSAAHRNRSKAKLAVPMSAFPGAKTL
ncbi:unnamed protein product, partial [Prorocentrum cordatum]